MCCVVGGGFGNISNIISPRRVSKVPFVIHTACREQGHENIVIHFPSF